MLPVIVFGRSVFVLNVIAAAATVAVTAKIRVRKPDGTIRGFSVSHTTVAADTAEETEDTESTGNGVVVAAHIESADVSTPASAYAVLSVSLRDDTGVEHNRQMICGGHLDGGYLPAPFYQKPQPHLRVIEVADPAAGVDLSYTLPNRLILEDLRSIYFQFVASATVASRGILIRGDDGADPIWDMPYGTAVTASQTRLFTFGSQPVNIVLNNNVTIPTNVGMALPPGGRIRTSISSLQAGDQISDFSIAGFWRWQHDMVG